MGKDENRLVELVRPALASGEELIATARVNSNGTVAPNRLILETALPDLGDHQLAAPPDPDLVVAFPTANQMALALTGGRIFVWSLGFSGKPKQFIGEVPLHAIRAVRSADRPRGTQLQVEMASGALVDLEFLKGEPAAEFVSHLRDLVGAGPDPSA